MSTFYKRGTFHMAGTEGTGDYSVSFDTALGAVGIRQLAHDRFRIRVEPTSDEAAAKLAKALPRECGFKQPGDDGQTRFSIEVNDAPVGEKRQKLIYPLKVACYALLEGGVPEFSPSTANLASDLVSKNALLADCKQRGVKGVNGRWSYATLCRKACGA